MQSYRLSTEADTLFGVEDRALRNLVVVQQKVIDSTDFPDKRLDSTSTAINLIQSDLADDLAAILSIPGESAFIASEDAGDGGCIILSELLNLLNLTRKFVCESVLQGLRNRRQRCSNGSRCRMRLPLTLQRNNTERHCML